MKLLQEIFRVILSWCAYSVLCVSGWHLFSERTRIRLQHEKYKLILLPKMSWWMLYCYTLAECIYHESMFITPEVYETKVEFLRYFQPYVGIQYIFLSHEFHTNPQKMQTFMNQICRRDYVMDTMILNKHPVIRSLHFQHVSWAEYSFIIQRFDMSNPSLSSFEAETFLPEKNQYLLPFFINVHERSSLVNYECLFSLTYLCSIWMLFHNNFYVLGASCICMMFTQFLHSYHYRIHEFAMNLMVWCMVSCHIQMLYWLYGDKCAFMCVCIAWIRHYTIHNTPRVVSSLFVNIQTVLMNVLLCFFSCCIVNK